MLEDYFGENVAEHYDTLASKEFAVSEIQSTVSFLAELAGDGGALELGIGTGRIALPLRASGIRVCGIDLSTAMVARLRAKPGAESIDVTIGDFSDATVDGKFSLAYLVFNTIMNLTSQDAQIACFKNVARHLEPAGHFVIEVLVPDLQRLPPGETIRPFAVSATHVGFDEYDVVTQSLVSHHYRNNAGRFDVLTVPFRYVWPSELDLMARLAGLTLAGRWADWNRLPFTSASMKHVSVWKLESFAKGSKESAST
jgi:SAM-dependent methyltransferase